VTACGKTFSATSRSSSVSSRAIHFAHSAFANLFEAQIVAESGADFESHELWEPRPRSYYAQAVVPCLVEPG